MTKTREIFLSKTPYVILVLAVIVLELIFYRNIIFDLNNLTGNAGDSRLVALILEHWHRVFGGERAIRDMPFFYPVTNTLGYTDTMFLVSLPYTLFRSVGFEWLTAYQFTLISIHFFGGLCLAFLLRKQLKLPVWACIIGLIIGNFSSAYFLRVTAHSQFITSGFVPLLFILLFYFFQNVNSGKLRARMIYGIASIILFAGILTTSVYVGYYIIIFFLFVAISVVIYLHRARIKTVKQMVLDIWKSKTEGFAYLLTAITALVPFIWIYLPVLREMGERSWGDVANHLPIWYDVFNVSPTNRLWAFPPTHFELHGGFTLITGVIMIICCVKYIKVKKQAIKNDITDNYDVMTRCITLGFCVSVAVITIILIRFDLTRLNVFGIIERTGLSADALSRFSLWYIIYSIIPGASVLRAAGRFYQFLMLPTGIVVAIYLSRKITKEKMKCITYIASIVILTTFIFIEQQNLNPMTDWSKSQLNEYLASVSPPPDDLESFFLVNNKSTVEWMVQLDAMTIADMYGINTINGYSGQFPADWHRYYFRMETNGNYTDISKWVDRHNLRNVYLYDYMNDLWIPYSEQALIELELQFLLRHQAEE
jgi:hypothetical protein